MEFDVIAGYLGRFKKGLLAVPKEVKQSATDIRLKIGSPVLICCIDGIRYLCGTGCLSNIPAASDQWIITSTDIENLFYSLCGYAVYSHIDELKHGFISLDRKFRVGVSGTAVTSNGELQTIRDISGLTIRVPRDIFGCADALYAANVRPEKGILLVGAPSSGKTTMLRDLARSLGRNNRTVVIDERFELVSDNYDLGICTDVLQGYPKRDGFSHALRCLSPQYILCDELDEEDLPALKSAFFAGVSLIATVHAGNKDDFMKRALCRKLIESGAFGFIVILKGRDVPTEIDYIYKAGELSENSNCSTFDHEYINDRLHRILSHEITCT